MSSQINIHQPWAFPGFMHLLNFIGRIPIPLSTCTQRSWFTILTFYALIPYEILSKLVPFESLIENNYSRELDFLLVHPVIAGLSGTFLPQDPGISRGLTNDYIWIGAILITGGLLTVSAGIAELYIGRPANRGAITRGIYLFIRHPQYTGLAVSGLGMLLLWPRYIVLMMYIAMLFGCYCLGRIEEHECKQKFGQTYVEYKRRTGMFLPFRFPFTQRLPRLPRSGPRRFLAIVTLYTLVTLTAVVFANQIKIWTLDNLNVNFTPITTNISVSKRLVVNRNNVASIPSRGLEVQTNLVKSARNHRENHVQGRKDKP